MGFTFLAFGRTVLVLGLVIGVLLVLARFARKWQTGGGRPGSRPVGRIEVVSRRSLGKHVSLLVVQVAQRTFLIGQSVQQMTMLAELDGDEWVKTNSLVSPAGRGKDQLLAPGTVLGTGGDSPGAWDAFIDHLREMTVRR